MLVKAGVRFAAITSEYQRSLSLGTALLRRQSIGRNPLVRAALTPGDVACRPVRSQGERGDRAEN